MNATPHSPLGEGRFGLPGGAFLAVMLGSSGAWAAGPDLSRLPAPVPRAVDFTADVKPILDQSCIRCHGPVKPRGGFRLDTKDAALKGGGDGVAIVPGNSARSPLIHYVARLVEDMEMPPAGKGDPLSAGQVALLRAWIDQGAAWGAEIPELRTRSSATVLVGWLGVSGDAHRYREHFGQTEGAFGGIDRFELEQRVGDQGAFRVEGRVLLDQSDYRVRLSLENPELGFVRGGFQQFRRYFDDSGGYYEPFPVPQFDLQRDLHLDYGSLWAEVGLTLPDAPRMVLGYEHQFRNGEKSLLQWGPSTQRVNNLNTTRFIYPASKDVNERVDIIRFDFSKDFAGLWVENNFRSECYDLETRRQTVLAFPAGQPAPTVRSVIEDDTSHNELCNTFKLEKQLTSWWLASAGYLYASLEGDAAFARSTLFGDPRLPAEAGDYSDQILISRESHFVNLNSQLGPWQGLTGSIGAQMEATTQHGLGELQALEFDPVLGGVVYQSVALDADLDKLGWEEKAVLRYSAIPYTILYVEGRWRQEGYGQYEQQTPGSHEFLRDTDAESDLQEYRAGFNLSPWRQVSLQAGYARRIKANDYDHAVDDNEVAGAGYSAFIRSHTFASDEVAAKLAVRPWTWLKLNGGWRWVSTDYETQTADVAGGLASQVPGGAIQSGTYEAHVGSGGVVLTPWSRLYASATYTYTDTRMETAQHGLAAVAPYRGTIHSVVVVANYALDDATDLTANYAFSRADYAQDNGATGLPLGIRYDLHALQAGIRRRFGPAVSVVLQYGFHEYAEPTSGGWNDYTAHAVWAGLHLRWP